MKHIVKLFIFTCLITIFALPVFADDPFPIYASFGTGDVIFSDVREIEEMSSEYEGDVVGEVDVIAIEELKTTLKIETDVANTVRWEKKISATGTEYCSNGVNRTPDYSTLTVVPKLNDVYYADVIRGNYAVKVKFAIKKIVPINTDFIEPCFITADVLEKTKTLNEYIDDRCEDYYYSKIDYRDYDEKTFLFHSNTEGVIGFDEKSEYQNCIHADADEKVVLVVGAVDGVEYSWSQEGS